MRKKIVALTLVFLQIVGFFSAIQSISPVHANQNIGHCTAVVTTSGFGNEIINTNLGTIPRQSQPHDVYISDIFDSNVTIDFYIDSSHYDINSNYDFSIRNDRINRGDEDLETNAQRINGLIRIRATFPIDRRNTGHTLGDNVPLREFSNNRSKGVFLRVKPSGGNWIEVCGQLDFNFIATPESCNPRTIEINRESSPGSINIGFDYAGFNPRSSYNIHFPQLSNLDKDINIPLSSGTTQESIVLPDEIIAGNYEVRIRRDLKPMFGSSHDDVCVTRIDIPPIGQRQEVIHQGAITAPLDTFPLCEQVRPEDFQACQDCFESNGGKSMWTGIGCIPTDGTNTIAHLV